MDFLKAYNRPYDNRIIYQLIVSLIMSSSIFGMDINKPLGLIKFLLLFFGVFLTFDLVLTRLDKLIKLLELK